eukprot:scaffold281_cov156-Skeletonema_menzelii.AAC.4
MCSFVLGNELKRLLRTALIEFDWPQMAHADHPHQRHRSRYLALASAQLRSFNRCSLSLYHSICVHCLAGD